MNKMAILVMIITIFSKAFGFIRDIVLSYYYGATNISDAYLISITIPNVIFAFIATGISTGFIPMYSKIKHNNGDEEGKKFTNNLINILIVLCTLIVLFGVIFTEQIVKLFASGFEGETLSIAVKFTKISLIGVYFTGLISIYKGYLQVNGNFIAPAFIAFPMNFFTILFLVLSSKINIILIPIGTVLAALSQWLFLIPFIKKKGYRYSMIINLKDKHIKNMAYIALPLILGVSVNQINVLVDRTLASGITEGGISALHYANTLNLFAQGIFVLSISTVMYPLISKMANDQKIENLKKLVSEVITGINVLVIPVSIGAIIFAEPIVELLFGRGAFGAEAIYLTASALIFYSIGMVGFGLREVLSRVFYALQDTKTPMINAAISVIINIILNIILSKYIGIGGLALATSISAIFCTFLLFFSLRKKIGSFGFIKITSSFAKILCASLVMGVVAKFSFNYIVSLATTNLSLFLAIGIGVFIYFIMIYFMKIEDVETLINITMKKLRKASK